MVYCKISNKFKSLVIAHSFNLQIGHFLKLLNNLSPNQVMFLILKKPIDLGRFFFAPLEVNPGLFFYFFFNQFRNSYITIIY